MAHHRAIKRRVWVGMVTGLAAVGAWAWWLKSRPMPVPNGVRGVAPFVRLAGTGSSGEDVILRERAELLDPTPLFFPTDRNYGQTPLNRLQQRLPGQVFGRFDPKWATDDQAIVAFDLNSASVPEKLSDVLVPGNEAPFGGFGERAMPTSTLPVRAGFVEVSRLGSGDRIMAQALTGIQVPRTDYAPMEFLVVVGPAGLIGEPVLISGSGWDEVDGFFRTYLVRAYHLGERLSPGRYRVVVGA